ncbi:hypothetical protein [Mycolicibacterium lacusdiani]|uniref:hypothetical protein n=1 Tax=Mycolicibacterium lacusdiani TaxID=2895283 RepID=UPI001F15F6AC|nr:hypothetical protein [Mycolicibacterium lacusdiani]
MTLFRILVVDDEETIASQTAELLRSGTISSRGEKASVDYTTSFADALTRLEDQRYDLVVLDIRDESAVEPLGDVRDNDDSTAGDLGLDVFQQVRSRKFIPVVFYTAVPNLAEDLVRSPFVDIISKQAEPEELRNKVRDVFDSTLPLLHAELLSHVEGVMRDFMMEFVEHHWHDLASPPRKGDVAHLLLRRLALSLASGGELLDGKLNDIPGVELQTDSVHPMRFYVMPPVGSLTTGDIIHGPLIGFQNNADGDVRPDSWYVVLTPACDLVTERLKAEFVVLARCIPLVETGEYAAWRDADRHNDQTQRKQLENTMRNRQRSGRNADRDFYLPSAWNIPDLVVDLQQIIHLTHADSDKYERLATLDSPYAEALVQKLGRYIGRIGTPDLDVTAAMARLEDVRDR